MLRLAVWQEGVSPCAVSDSLASLLLSSEQATIKCVAITMKISLQIEDNFICLPLLLVRSTKYFMLAKNLYRVAGKRSVIKQ